MHIPDLALPLVPVRYDNLLQEFKHWGPEYKIEFDITVTQFEDVNTQGSRSWWTNVFHFTYGGGKYGSTFPSLMIDNREKKFRIEEKIPTYYGFTKFKCDIAIKLNHKYHFEIRTTHKISGGANGYRFEIFVDKKRKAHEEFTKNAKPRKKVLLYASDPWKKSSFNSSLGKLESFSVFTRQKNKQ